MTVNTVAPNGFTPVHRFDGAVTNWAVNPYVIASAYATAIYTGDPVKLINDGTIALAAPGDTIRGIFQGCKYKDASGTWQFSKNWPASATYQGGMVEGNMEAFVIDDPNVLFKAQFASTATFTQANVGEVFDHTAAAGNTSTGISKISMATTSGTSGKVWQFVRFATAPAQDITTANPWVIFQALLHDRRASIIGI